MYPPIPIFEPQSAIEHTYDFGARAFTYLVRERVTPGVLDTEPLEAALHYSQYLVTAKDTAPAALTLYHAIRSQIHEVLTRRRQEATPPPTAEPITRSHDRPNDGPMATLRTPPGTQPPAPVRLREPVHIDF